MTLVRAQGELQVCHEMFKRNMSKIIDDPVRFSYAYLSFLTEEGSLRELNSGFAILRRTLLQHVSAWLVETLSHYCGQEKECTNRVKIWRRLLKFRLPQIRSENHL